MFPTKKIKYKYNCFIPMWDTLPMSGIHFNTGRVCLCEFECRKRAEKEREMVGGMKQRKRERMRLPRFVIFFLFSRWCIQLCRPTYWKIQILFPGYLCEQEAARTERYPSIGKLVKTDNLILTVTVDYQNLKQPASAKPVIDWLCWTTSIELYLLEGM